MSEPLDVVIIGAGSAGLAALREVKKKTDRFVIINDGPYGTTCARVGCMPSKVLIEAANAFHARHKAEAFGIRGSSALTIDLPAVLQRVRTLRDRFVAGTLTATDDLGERSIAGRAKMLGPNTVAVGERELQARHIIIATGSSPIVPKPWRKLGDRVLTTDTLFEQTSLPRRMAVIGLGVLGIELAQALARLGVEVTAFGTAPMLAGLTDEAVNACLRDALSKEITLHTGYDAELVDQGQSVQVRAGKIEIEVDRVLVAIGRKPNLDGLGLDSLGVVLDENGMPPFNPQTTQIADLPVFIAGDVDAHLSLLHEAADEGFIAGVNAVNQEITCFQRRTPLAIVFSDPGVAVVGERFAALDPNQIVIGQVNFENQGRALAAQRNHGLIRLYARHKDARLLGAEMCAPAAEHMAHLLALAIGQGLTAHDLLGMPFYHPVLEEGLRSALRDLAGKTAGRRSDLAACQAFDIEALD